MTSNKNITVIAVDGPAASGKGTFAKALAARLHYAYLDTGALYRLVGLTVLQQGGDPTKLADVQTALKVIKYPLTAEQLSNPELRTLETGDAGSMVAVIPEVRAVVRAYQESFIKAPPDNAPGVVLDGRDIGTVICPTADLKFFVIASAEERARRRFEEQKLTTPGITYETVLKEINARDERDRSRPVSPLRPAADAYTIDTTKSGPAETLEQGLKIFEAKLKKKSLKAPKRNQLLNFN